LERGFQGDYKVPTGRELCRQAFGTTTKNSKQNVKTKSVVLKIYPHLLPSFGPKCEDYIVRGKRGETKGKSFASSWCPLLFFFSLGLSLPTMYSLSRINVDQNKK